MKKSILLAVALLLVAQVAVAATLSIKCPPIIVVKATKLFATNKKYVCFKTAADAKKAGYQDEAKIKKSWKAVTTFNGSVDQQSESFTINASQWRMSWNHTGEGDFSIVVYDANNNDYKKLMVNHIGPTKAISNYYGAGRFYLDIGGSPDWTVTVEEYR